MRLGSWWDHASQTQTEELPLCQIESNPRTKAILCEQNKFEAAHKFAQHPCPILAQQICNIFFNYHLSKVEWKNMTLHRICAQYIRTKLFDRYKNSKESQNNIDGERRMTKLFGR